MPPAVGLRVGRSRIHGYGLFATRAFAKGSRLIDADGVVYQDHDEFDDTYALVAYRDRGNAGAGRVFLDLADQTRWINHSCDPNTTVETAFEPATGELRASWFALREIAQGDELTYDYAFSGAVAEACGCSAAACRGVIVDLDPQEVAQVVPGLRALLRLPVADGG